MDNVTHALAGLLLADITVSWMSERAVEPLPRRLVAGITTLGVIAAEFPDSDLVYSSSALGMGNLGYLMHHRGHTHTIIWAVLSAVMLWLVTRWLLERRASDDERAALRAGATWPLLLLALMGTLSHILLDWTNSYGVHPFWPFDNRWFYGDSVFIVEPWLWVIGIPAVLFSRRTVWAKGVLGVLLLVILAASWGLNQVARPVAMALTGFVLVWLALQWRFSTLRRAQSGLVVWVAATLLFFAASSRAEALVRASTVGGGASVQTVRDIVRNPAPGDPTCWTVLAVTTDGLMYRLTSAQVASLGTVASCRARYPEGSRVGGDAITALPDATPVVPFASSAQVQWGRSWARPMSELVGLAEERCEIAVALRFMRTPVWREFGNGMVVMSDARFGAGGGFAEVTVPFSPDRACSLRGTWVPGWTPPAF